MRLSLILQTFGKSHEIQHFLREKNVILIGLNSRYTYNSKLKTLIKSQKEKILGI